MVKVFSFCIYGDQKKYCQGLIENIEQIKIDFPDFQVWIYTGTNLPENYLKKYESYNNTKIIKTDRSGASLMCYRFFPIDNPDVQIQFTRDADSRISNREKWCINQFIDSDKMVHIIRDHYWHKRRVASGLIGFKKGFLDIKLEDLYNMWIFANNNVSELYDTDQLFQEELVYPIIEDRALIHSNVIAFKDEVVHPIEYPLETDKTFMGNVWIYKSDSSEAVQEFSYSDFPHNDHINWLRNQNQGKVAERLINELGIHEQLNKNYFSKMFYSKNYDKIKDSFKELDVPNMDHSELYFILLIMLKTLENTEDYDRVLDIFDCYDYCFIDEEVLKLSSKLIEKMNYKVVATTNLSREPKDSELVVCYGNYYHASYALPGKNKYKFFRHPLYFNLMNHDVVEFDDCWDKIDVIYVLNLEERRDRYIEILLELCKVNAPLHRIYHYKAKKESITNNRTLDAYIGATKNHLDVVDHFIEKEYNYCLILEDDFTFTSNYEKHKEELKEFIKREYDFDVCLISTSKYFKIKPHDDLLSLSYQECTTSSGYILNKKTVGRIQECFKTGYEKMIETGDHHKYVCDRYWKKLQKDNKFFVFKEKFGYQRPNYSSTINRTTCHFD